MLNLEYISCGVPQGSVLGPLLFSLYVIDMPLASSFKTTLFADDTLLMMTGYDLNKLQQQVNQNLAVSSEVEMNRTWTDNINLFQTLQLYTRLDIKHQIRFTKLD